MPGWWKSLQNDYLDNAVLYIVLFIRVLKTLVPDLWRDMLWRDIQVHMHLSGWYFLKFHCASESHSTKYWEKNLAVPDPSSNFHSKQCNKWQTCQTRWVGGIPTARVCQSVLTVSPVMLLQMEELHPAPFLLQCLVKQSYHYSGGRWERFLQQRDSGKGEVNASSHWLYQANHRTVFLFLCKNMYKKKNAGQMEEEGEKRVRNYSVNTKIREGGRGGGALGTGAGIPCSLWRGPWWSRHFPAVHEGTPLWSRWILPEGTATCGEPTLEQKFIWRTSAGGWDNTGKEEAVRRKGSWGKNIMLQLIPGHFPPVLFRGRVEESGVRTDTEF